MSKVTVLMSVYNGERYLREAIESMLRQTFTDFEFIIIDDASRDTTPFILADYAARDTRIAVITNERNLGLTASLNKGLALARGQYLARLDADDVALPERLARQVDFLEQHPDCVLLGSAYDWIDEEGRKIGAVRPPTNDTHIRWQTLFNCAFGHSTVIFRLSALRVAGLTYCTEFVQTQDYELWSRLLQSGRGGNLDDHLVLYRIHADQDSNRQFCTQYDLALQVAEANLRRLGFRLKRDEVALLRRVYERDASLELERPGAGYGLLLSILRIFAQQPDIDKAVIFALRRRYAGEILSNLSLRRLHRREQQRLLWLGWRYDHVSMLVVVSQRIREYRRKWFVPRAISSSGAR